MGKLRVLMLLVVAVSLVATPALAQNKPLISLGSSKDLGNFLVDNNGMTLYIFTVDPLNDSACYDQCAKAWPPLLVDSADKITVADGIPGKFSTITRKDGKLQVAYNGAALYYWFKDKQAGDTTGHRVARTWWVVPPATAYAQRIPKLGNVLVGPTGMTLYTFAKDTTDTSNCYDTCADNWPALLVDKAESLVPGVNLQGKFNTFARKDGKLQVSYNGMPLYTFKKDMAIGDANGEKVGDAWFSVVPETVGVSNTKDLGDFLISYDGMTVYTYAKDTTDTSNCTADCLKAWPPLTVMDLDRLAAPSTVKGKLGTITRADNKAIQVTYNGMPLYVFAKDTKPGDTTGQNVGNVWSVVKP